MSIEEKEEAEEEEEEKIEIKRREGGSLKQLRLTGCNYISRPENKQTIT